MRGTHKPSNQSVTAADPRGWEGHAGVASRSAGRLGRRGGGSSFGGASPAAAPVDSGDAAAAAIRADVAPPVGPAQAAAGTSAARVSTDLSTKVSGWLLNGLP
jgi:hypothetical protein